jgi:hypothetical protein
MPPPIPVKPSRHRSGLERCAVTLQRPPRRRCKKLCAAPHISFWYEPSTRRPPTVTIAAAASQSFGAVMAVVVGLSFSANSGCAAPGWLGCRGARLRPQRAPGHSVASRRCHGHPEALTALALPCVAQSSRPLVCRHPCSRCRWTFPSLFRIFDVRGTIDYRTLMRIVKEVGDGFGGTGSSLLFDRGWLIPYRLNLLTQVSILTLCKVPHC